MRIQVKDKDKRDIIAAWWESYLLGSKTPAALRTSPQIGTCEATIMRKGRNGHVRHFHDQSASESVRDSEGQRRTVELTGLEMTQMKAVGQ